MDFYGFSFWESTDAIRAFAGDDISRARYYPRDREFFAELEPAARHFTVRTATISLA